MTDSSDHILLPTTKTNLRSNIEQATATLLEMVRASCWNVISDNTSFIISEIVNDKTKFSEQRIERKKANEKKTPLSLEQATDNLQAIFDNLYDINLYVYKSERDSTIVEIQYFLKTSLDSKYYESIKDKEPMLHCKVAIPKYKYGTNKKFDVNWELGGLRYELNTIWAHLKFKLKYRGK